MENHARLYLSERLYVDNDQNYYVLDRVLDAFPKYFMAYGPIKEGFIGILPVLKITGLENCKTWNEAEKLLKS